MLMYRNDKKRLQMSAFYRGQIVQRNGKTVQKQQITKKKWKVREIQNHPPFNTYYTMKQ